MGINKGSFKSKLRCIIIVFFCALFIFVFFPEPFPQVQAQSTQIPIDVNNTHLTVVGKSTTGLTVDAGEFYRVDGRKVRLLRSLDKVVVHYTSDQRPNISKRVNTRQVTGKPFVVEQELAKEKTLVMGTPDISTLAELDETINQIQRESDISQVTPVYINEETGLEVIPTDQFIVKISPEATPEQLETLNKRMGTSLVRRLRGTTDQFILRMDALEPEGLLAMCETYSNDPIIVWASPNFFSQIVYDSFGGDYEYHSNQWHLEMIDAAGAWDVTTGSKDIVVAVIDNGIDIDHEDLRDSFPDNTSDSSDNGYPNDYYGWDFYNNNNNPRPGDPKAYHGTAAAGVIAAKGNNDKGVSGCAYNCTLMSLQLIEGEGENASWAMNTTFAEALLYAAGFHEDGIGRWHGADVINMSLGFNPSWEVNEALHKAATEGRGGKGCLIFCSSGNDSAGWTPRSITGFSSGQTYTFRWEYSKAPSGSPNKGTVWLDSVSFPGEDEEHFEGGIPSGWQTGGSSNWISIQDGLNGNHAMTGWDGQYSKAMRAGPVDSDQSSFLEITKSVGEGSFQFWYWPSMEPGEKLDFIVEFNGDEVYRETFSEEKKGQDYIPYLLPIVTYPALHPDTMAVGASTNFDYRADYSRYGFGLDFVAPSGGGSQAIYTTDRTDIGSQIQGDVEGEYNPGFSGTSAASPLAAAVGALMLSANPNLTAAQVKDIMQDTCEKIDNEPYNGESDQNLNTNTFYGHGRINANLAVNRASTYNSNDPNEAEEIEFVYIDDPGGGIFGRSFIGEISTYEITNAQYCQYLNAALADGLITIFNGVVYDTGGTVTFDHMYDYPCFTTHPTSSYSQIIYSEGTFFVRNRDGMNMANHPVVMVSFYGAQAFCSYYGYSLPNAYQWAAVADYDGSYIYGCGTSIDSSKANYNRNNPLSLSSEPYTTPVGYYPKYGYGMCDMAGNVSELTGIPGNEDLVYVCGGDYTDSDNWQLSNILQIDTNEMSREIGFRVCRK